MIEFHEFLSTCLGKEESAKLAFNFTELDEIFNSFKIQLPKSNLKEFLIEFTNDLNAQYSDMEVSVNDYVDHKSNLIGYGFNLKSLKEEL